MKLPRQLLLVFFICHAFCLQAQWRIGVTGGAVLATLVRDSQLNSRGGQLGYFIGADVRRNLGDLGWFVQSGVSYTLEGDHDQNLNFIKVPIMLGWDFSDDVGIYMVYNFAWQVGDQNGVQDFYNSYANILGLACQIYPSEKIALGIRLNHGLSNLVRVPADAKNLNIKPLTLDLYLTYFLFN